MSMDLKEWIIDSCEKFLSGPRTGPARGRKVQILEWQVPPESQVDGLWAEVSDGKIKIRVSISSAACDLWRTKYTDDTDIERYRGGIVTLKQFRPDLASVTVPTASRPFMQLILRIEELAPYGSVGTPPIGNPRHITNIHDKHHRLIRKLDAGTSNQPSILGGQIQRTNDAASGPIPAPDSRPEESARSSGASTSEPRTEQPENLKAKTDHFRTWKRTEDQLNFLLQNVNVRSRSDVGASLDHDSSQHTSSSQKTGATHLPSPTPSIPPLKPPPTSPPPHEKPEQDWCASSQMSASCSGSPNGEGKIPDNASVDPEEWPSQERSPENRKIPVEDNAKTHSATQVNLSHHSNTFGSLPSPEQTEQSKTPLSSQLRRSHTEEVINWELTPNLRQSEAFEKLATSPHHDEPESTSPSKGALMRKETPLPSVGIFESFSGRYAATSDPSPVPSPTKSLTKPSAANSHSSPNLSSLPDSKTSSQQPRVMVPNSDSDPLSQSATGQCVAQPEPSASRDWQEDPFLDSFTRPLPTKTRPAKHSLDMRIRKWSVNDQHSPVGTVLGKRTSRDSAGSSKTQIGQHSPPPSVPNSASKDIPTIDLSKPAKTIRRQIAKQRKSQVDVRQEYVAQPMTWLDCRQIMANVIRARTNQGVHEPEKI